jgi:hypothetical protein
MTSADSAGSSRLFGLLAGLEVGSEIPPEGLSRAGYLIERRPTCPGRARPTEPGEARPLRSPLRMAELTGLVAVSSCLSQFAGS